LLTYRLELDPELKVPSPCLADGLEVWKDHEGRVCASGGKEGDRFWLWFPEFACFSFHPQQEVATYRPVAAAREATIFDLFRRTVVPLIYQLDGHVVLHGSAIRAREGVVVFCARSHTGKSTLANAFHHQSFPFWADDAVVVESTATETRVLSLPARLRLRPASHDYFQGAGELENLAVWPDHGAEQGAPIHTICLLHRTAADPEAPLVQTARVPEIQAMIQLLEHAYSFTLDEVARRQALLAQYHRLARSVPVCEVRLQSGLELLPVVVEALAAKLGLTSP